MRKNYIPYPSSFWRNWWPDEEKWRGSPYLATIGSLAHNIVQRSDMQNQGYYIINTRVFQQRRLNLLTHNTLFTCGDARYTRHDRYARNSIDFYETLLNNFVCVHIKGSQRVRGDLIYSSRWKFVNISGFPRRVTRHRASHRFKFSSHVLAEWDFLINQSGTIWYSNSPYWASFEVALPRQRYNSDERYYTGLHARRLYARFFSHYKMLLDNLNSIRFRRFIPRV